jgi:hypothetical protein
LPRQSSCNLELLFHTHIRSSGFVLHVCLLHLDTSILGCHGHEAAAPDMSVKQELEIARILPHNGKDDHKTTRPYTARRHRHRKDGIDGSLLS